MTPSGRLVLLGALLGAAATANATPIEKVGVGYVFVTANSGTAPLRTEPSGEAKVANHAPRGARLVFRRMMVEGSDPVWYMVQPPASTATLWVSAKDVSHSPPTPFSPGKPLKLLDSGVENVRATSSMTAAAHGLDDRARNYGEKQGMKTSVDQFVTLEKAVEDLYDDHHSEKDASYDETKDNPVRAKHANGFAKELAR